MVVEAKLRTSITLEIKEYNQLRIKKLIIFN